MNNFCKRCQGPMNIGKALANYETERGKCVGSHSPIKMVLVAKCVMCGYSHRV